MTHDNMPRSTGEALQEIFLAIASLKTSLCRLEDSHACRALGPRLDALSEKVHKLVARDVAVAKLTDEVSVLKHAQQALERAWKFFKDEIEYKSGKLERAQETLERAQDNIEKEQGDLEKTQKSLERVIEMLETRLRDEIADEAGEIVDSIH